ncbi:hypothetical protein MP638_006028 [Amoeboaphelidium occidentale]|nr:hypothetical protein MP638_006028 [Amoeboaphelidium occidentale]
MVKLSYRNILDAFTTWIREPQFLSRTYLRAEILSNALELEKLRASSIYFTVPGICDNLQFYYRRKVVPKIHREDNTFAQDLFVCHDGHSLEIYHEFVQNIHLQGQPSMSNLPYFYPKVKYFSFRFDFNTNEMLYHYEMLENTSQTDEENTKEVLQHISRLLLKFAYGSEKGYKKRVPTDMVVDKIKYQDKYLRLKKKYRHWVDIWSQPFYVNDIRHKGMSTDPQKHVFEDISILTFLCCLWEEMYEGDSDKVRFLDMGCGNGFLTYLLGQEGYEGVGVDLVKREVWERYEKTDRIQLIETVINPKTFQSHFTDVERYDVWLIGNHADELTGWIPLLCSKFSLDSGFEELKYKCIVIPCCYYDLAGNKNAFGTTLPSISHSKKDKDKDDPLQGNYGAYVEWTEDIFRNSCGIEPEREWLRIPSTKNLAIIGRKWSDIDAANEKVNNLITGTYFKARDTKKKEKIQFNSDDKENTVMFSELPDYDSDD